MCPKREKGFFSADDAFAVNWKRQSNAITKISPYTEITG